MLTRKAKLLLSLTAAIPLLFAACKDNNILNPLNDAAGTYQLTVYAGRSIPATYTIPVGDPTYPNGGTFVVSDGSMVLNSNGTFIETNNYVTTQTGGSPQNSSFVSSGTWALSGTAFTLNASPQNGNGARNVTGTLDVDTISYQEANGQAASTRLSMGASQNWLQGKGALWSSAPFFCRCVGPGFGSAVNGITVDSVVVLVFRHFTLIFARSRSARTVQPFAGSHRKDSTIFQGRTSWAAWAYWPGSWLVSSLEFSHHS